MLISFSRSNYCRTAATCRKGCRTIDDSFYPFRLSANFWSWDSRWYLSVYEHQKVEASLLCLRWPPLAVNIGELGTEWYLFAVDTASRISGSTATSLSRCKQFETSKLTSMFLRGVIQRPTMRINKVEDTDDGRRIEVSRYWDQSCTLEAEF